ncbi:hypothetical protein AAC387_Pa08g1352 [Persea americana]
MFTSCNTTPTARHSPVRPSVSSPSTSPSWDHQLFFFLLSAALQTHSSSGQNLPLSLSGCYPSLPCSRPLQLQQPPAISFSSSPPAISPTITAGHSISLPLAHRPSACNNPLPQLPPDAPLPPASPPVLSPTLPASCHPPAPLPHPASQHLHFISPIFS